MISGNRFCFRIEISLFFSGQGRIVFDEIRGTDLHMAGVGRPRPVWTLCSKGNFMTGVQPDEATTTNVTLVESVCRRLIHSQVMRDQCGALGDAVAQYFYSSCVDDAVKMNTMTQIAYAVQAYADFCQHALCLSAWPATSLCRSMPAYMNCYRCRRIYEPHCISGYVNASGK